MGHITLLGEQPGLPENVPASGDWRKTKRLELDLYDPFQPKLFYGSVIIVGSICCQLLPFPEQILHYPWLTVPVPFLALTGLGHVVLVSSCFSALLVLYSCLEGDNGECGEGSLCVGMCVTWSGSGIKYLTEVHFGHLKSYKPHEKSWNFCKIPLTWMRTKVRRF